MKKKLLSISVCLDFSLSPLGVELSLFLRNILKNQTAPNQKHLGGNGGQFMTY